MTSSLRSRRLPVPHASGRASLRAPRVAILGTPGSATNLLLVRAWRELGIDARAVDADAVTQLPWDAVVGRVDVRRTLEGLDPGLLTLLRLERRGIPVLNGARALAAAHDKLLTARLLAAAGLPHPPTRLVRSVGAVPDLPFPVVVKPRLGSWGVDVLRCASRAELEVALATLGGRPWFRHRGAVVQALVPPRGFDLRLLVSGGEVVGAVNRVAAPGEWRTNVSLGARRRRTIAPPAAAALGIAAAAAIGADLVGIDLLPDGDGWTVLELNGAADFDPTYGRPGSDVACDVARALHLDVLAGVPKA